MREVVEWWATLPGQTAAEKVRAAEAEVLVTYNTKLLDKALRGEEILPGAFDAEPNLLWAETSELLGIYGGNENAPAEALAYLAEHGGKIPAIELELHLMGQLAERYAPDGAQPSSVAKSKLQNDCGDFQALSNFLPYCDGGIFDIRATELFRDATRALNRRQYRIWAGSQTDEFVKWIDELPVLEPGTVPSSEICALKGRVLLYVSMKPRRMIRRELIQDEPRIEILPQGGVAVSSESLSWPELYHLLEEAKMAHVGGIGDSGWVYAGNGGSEEMLIKHCVTMGMFSIEPELAAAIEGIGGGRTCGLDSSSGPTRA